MALLENALILPALENQWNEPIAQLRSQLKRADLVRGSALRHASACGLILVGSALVPLPLGLITGATLLALLPLVKEVILKWQLKRIVPAEALELAFSAALVSQGLAGEALLDLAIGDASDALENLVINQDGGHSESLELIERLTTIVSLDLVAEHQTKRQLHEMRCGDRYRLVGHSHVFLESTIVEGNIIIISRLEDGDWRPKKLGVGERVDAGAFLINGSAVLEVQKEFGSHGHYLTEKSSTKLKSSGSTLDHKANQFTNFMTPLLLGIGGVFYGFGAIDRGFGFLQFNPVHDWKTSRNSLLITAVASLRLHGIHVNDSNALIALARVQHLVISRSWVDRLAGIQVRECRTYDGPWQNGDLVRFLAGVQNHLLDLGQVAIWSEQLQHVANPMTIDRIELQDLEIGWNVSLADGSRVILKQPQLQPSTPQSQSQFDPLEVWRDDECMGSIELISRDNETFEDMCNNLHELGITIHIISDNIMTEEPQNKTHYEPALLHRYPHIVSADERLGLVQQLQANGDGVAYIGHVLDDVPGLAQADVSLGINIDPGSIFSLDICDISIEADLNWLPRIIHLSKNLDHTTITNFGLIGVTNLVAALAAAAAWINPLTIVLLSDIPLVIVEIRNINSMHFHRKLTTPYGPNS